MPATQQLSTKPLGQVPTNDKTEINQMIDDLVSPFGGDTLSIPIKNMPAYVGNLLKAAQIAPKALEIFASITTIQANLVTMAGVIYESLRVDRLQCICDELKCTNSLLRQHLVALDADQRQKLDSVRVVHAGLNQIAVTVAAATQALSIEELPNVNGTNPVDSSFATDYLIPKSEQSIDRVTCNSQ